MSIIQWNIRSIHSNHEQVRVLFRDANATVLCLQETKLGQHSFNPGVNFKFYRSPPLNEVHAQGGTAFVVRKSLNHKEIPIDSVLQACVVQVFANRWITLCSVYLEPRL